ncbi:YegP family protein [Paludisphaera mucosa]|uniref:DUF1508 domain-containing protein n=1 Tax=Paludisphaera mucosa TaxID=3030827 RepID=A0ABT6FA52_9BACT|nr:DUF1508 domain-containing protein [Paludisphaera mucosa]MDG3004471.1 DUF1508 domain-containing protein [Paludisphaera mucosa]
MKFVLYRDKRGEYRWRLVASNGKIIATSSEGYKDKRDCQAMIDAIRKNGSATMVVDEVAAK